MSELKLISPMLDNFGMGAPISVHYGVCCCPAMEQTTEDKYIVKIISIPASQRQLDALLLSGAYGNAAEAKEYFRGLSADVIEEAQILQKLSEIEGFLPYQKWQVVEMEDATGFDVYLLGSYKRSLERHLRRNAMTHLAAVNLGLDLCAALAACRRSGYLYVDLKPENVFITEDQEYRIGDLGFIRLSSLRYASLPDKYRSRYTAPEVSDAFSALNATLDTYALGLMLYQAYNDGKLPFSDDAAPAAEFPAPEYADEEMAQIILKACAPNPEDRWQDPIQMGQALVAYMQRNGANDVPIVPIGEPDAEAVPEIADDMDSSDSGAYIADADVISNENVPSDSESETEEIAAPPVDVVDADSGIIEAPADEDAVIYAEVCPEELADAEDVQTPAEEQAVCEPQMENTEPTEAAEEDEEEFENLSFLDYLNQDTVVPGFEETELSYDTLSQDVSDMLSQADTLAALTVPEPVVAPEPIEVPIPEPIVLEKEYPDQKDIPEEDAESAAEAIQPVNKADEPGDPEAEDLEETPYLPNSANKKRKRRWVPALIVALLLLALAFGSYFFYANYYIQTVDAIRLEGSEDTLTVYLTTEADEQLLSVFCSDIYGNRFEMPVQNGCAVFTGLNPNTYYYVEVAIEGFHGLRGETAKTYSTPAQTEIVQLHAITGGTDGSVILSFTVNGPDSQQWKALYWTDGGAPQEVTFSNHVVTITGLIPGTEYTFRIEPMDDLFVTGKTEIIYRAASLIYAEDLKISGCLGSELTATWNAPAGVQVSSWSVRCYNSNGYNQTMTVTGTTAAFTGIDHTQSYTVEVTAEGMSISQQVHFAANTLTVNNFNTDFSDPTRLTITWDSCSPISSDGWVLLYTADGSDTPVAVSASNNAAVISPIVPGATYEITLQAANGAAVLGGSFTCKAPAAKVFSCSYQGFAITGSSMIFHMCKTPAKANWDRGDLAASDYTTKFTSGEKASFLVQMTKAYGTSNDPIETLFVIRDANGKLIFTGTSTKTWTQMWYKNYCELDIPAIPTAVGNYTVTVYFNGGLAAQVDFSII